MKHFIAIVLIISMVSCISKDKPKAGISSDYEIAQLKTQKESAV